MISGRTTWYFQVQSTFTGTELASLTKQASFPQKANLKFIIKIYICRNNLIFIIFFRSYHMISKYGNYIPSLKKVIFFQIWERVTNLLVVSMGSWQTVGWCNFLSLTGFQHKSLKVVVSWWSHHMIFHKMDIIGQSLLVCYDGNITTNALKICTGLQNTLEIMPNREENKFEPI